MPRGHIFEPNQVVFKSEYWRLLSIFLQFEETDEDSDYEESDSTSKYISIIMQSIKRQYPTSTFSVDDKEELNKLLLCACCNDETALVKHLLALGADPETMSVHLTTSIMYAAENDNFELVKIFSALVDPLKKYGPVGCTALTFAPPESTVYTFLQSLNTANRVTELEKTIVDLTQAINDLKSQQSASAQSTDQPIDISTLSEKTTLNYQPAIQTIQPTTQIVQPDQTLQPDPTLQIVQPDQQVSAPAFTGCVVQSDRPTSIPAFDMVAHTQTVERLMNRQSDQTGYPPMLPVVPCITYKKTVIKSLSQLIDNRLIATLLEKYSSVIDAIKCMYTPVTGVIRAGSQRVAPHHIIDSFSYVYGYLYSPVHRQKLITELLILAHFGAYVSFTQNTVRIHELNVSIYFHTLGSYFDLSSCAVDVEAFRACNAWITTVLTGSLYDEMREEFNKCIVQTD
jgi:hypothetical protein